MGQKTCEKDSIAKRAEFLFNDSLFPKEIEPPKLKNLRKFAKATPPAKRSARIQARSNSRPMNAEGDSSFNNFQIAPSRTKFETSDSLSLITLNAQILSKTAEALDNKFESVKKLDLEQEAHSSRSNKEQDEKGEEKINFQEALLKFKKRETQEEGLPKLNFKRKYVPSEKKNLTSKRFCTGNEKSQSFFAELKERIRQRSLALGIDQEN